MIPINIVDIHTHILPGVDDGPNDLQESVEMSKIAYGEGIRTIVCTPHAKGDYDSLLGCAQDRLLRLRVALGQENVPLTLLLGFEVLAKESLLKYEHLKDMAFRLGKMDCMLLEFDFCRFPQFLKEILQWLKQENIRPILAHPERYPYLLGNIAFLKNLSNSGVLLQINTGSITGEYGKSIQKFAKDIVQNGLVDFIATDMHSCRKRGPYVKRAVRILESWTSSSALASISTHSFINGFMI